MTATSRTSSSRSPGDRRRAHDRNRIGTSRAPLPRRAYPGQPNQDGRPEPAAARRLAPVPGGDGVGNSGSPDDERGHPVSPRAGARARRVPTVLRPVAVAARRRDDPAGRGPGRLWGVHARRVPAAIGHVPVSGGCPISVWLGAAAAPGGALAPGSRHPLLELADSLDARLLCLCPSDQPGRVGLHWTHDIRRTGPLDNHGGAQHSDLHQPPATFRTQSGNPRVVARHVRTWVACCGVLDAVAGPAHPALVIAAGRRLTATRQLAGWRLRGQRPRPCCTGGARGYVTFADLAGWGRCLSGAVADIRPRDRPPTRHAPRSVHDAQRSSASAQRGGDRRTAATPTADGGCLEPRALGAPRRVGAAVEGMAGYPTRGRRYATTSHRLPGCRRARRRDRYPESQRLRMGRVPVRPGRLRRGAGQLLHRGAHERRSAQANLVALGVQLAGSARRAAASAQPAACDPNHRRVLDGECRWRRRRLRSGGRTDRGRRSLGDQCHGARHVCDPARVIRYAWPRWMPPNDRPLHHADPDRDRGDYRRHRG